jgi:hypothetical protein
MRQKFEYDESDGRGGWVMTRGPGNGLMYSDRGRLRALSERCFRCHLVSDFAFSYIQSFRPSRLLLPLATDFPKQSL